MSQHDAVAIRRPRTNNRPLMDFAYGGLGFNALPVAHNLKVFPLLAEAGFTDIEVKPTWGY